MNLIRPSSFNVQPVAGGELILISLQESVLSIELPNWAHQHAFKHGAAGTSNKCLHAHVAELTGKGSAQAVATSALAKRDDDME
jgi:hypothetical protein